MEMLNDLDRAKKVVILLLEKDPSTMFELINFCRIKGYPIDKRAKNKLRRLHLLGKNNKINYHICSIIIEYRDIETLRKALA